MTPAELLDDHQRKPRNVGKLLNASAVGDVGSIVVGDALRFYIGVSGGKITQAKYQVFNCADQVAASSVLTEVVAGKTFAEAKALGPSAICAHLGGLDHTALPPRLWAVDGLRAAIAAYESDEVDADAELDPLLCRCFGIAEETARQAVRVSGCTTVDEVVNATGAGTGCGTCRADIPRLIEEATTPQAAAAPAPGQQRQGPAGRIQTLLRIQRLVGAKLLPAWQAQGATVELWDFDGRMVKVRVGGSFVTDADARRLALGELEQLLKAEVEASLGVEETV
ncbi:MAG: iron-sulfur cluster assembly scaffold protein [Planctomycetes bacterium]|nr:iron-sulfur cluster assembly scaffold protein [Planctomycetota bacterium]